MKLLKLNLADGKKYTFSTFTLKEMIGLRKKKNIFEGIQDEINKLTFQHDEQGNIKTKPGTEEWLIKTPTDEEKKRLTQLEEELMDLSIDICRKSICRAHAEFAKDKDKEKDQVIRENLMELMDVSDLKRITQFAMNGTYIREENEYDDTDIDLEVETKDSKSDKK